MRHNKLNAASPPSSPARMKYAFPVRRVFGRGWPSGVKDVVSSPISFRFLTATYSRPSGNYIDSSLPKAVTRALQEQHREAGVPRRVPPRGPRAVFVLRAHHHLHGVRIPVLTAKGFRRAQKAGPLDRVQIVKEQAALLRSGAGVLRGR